MPQAFPYSMKKEIENEMIEIDLYAQSNMKQIKQLKFLI